MPDPLASNVCAALTLTGSAGWNADVTLVDGTTNVIEVKNGDEVVYVKEVAYTAPAVTGSDIIIRKSDSLLLKAGGGLNAKIPMQIDTNADGTPDGAAFTGSNFAVKYADAGTYQVAAKIDRNKDGDYDDENESGQTLTVRVVEVNWNGPIACQQGFERVKNDVEVNGMAHGEVTFTTSNPVACILESAGGVANHPMLTIKPLTVEEHVMQARLGGVKGPIISECALDTFFFNNYAAQLHELPIRDVALDGTLEAIGHLLMRPKVKDLEVKLHIFVWGATFENGLIDISFLTNSFIPNTNLSVPDGTSIKPYLIYVTKERQLVHGPCHTFKIYQNGVVVGQNY